MPSRVDLSEAEIRIVELSICNKDSIGFLARIPEADRVSVVQKAVEIGLFCLERGENAGDLEFVRRQINELLGSVEIAVRDIPKNTESALLGKIGVENGQVLAPVKVVVDQAKRETQNRIDEVKSLLANDLDPSKSTTVLGQALSALRDLLNPQKVDSVQYRIDEAVNKVVKPDGALADVVKTTVVQAMKPLENEVNRLTSEFRGQEKVEEALAETPAKGPKYEDEVGVELQSWAKMTGYLVEYVGPDNQPGDYVINVEDEWGATGPFRIVLEARDRQSAFGKQKIAQDLEPKFRERSAHAGIYVSKTLAGLAKEVGDWAEGQCNSGPWIACTNEHLLTAVRFAIVHHRFKEMKQAQPEIDAADIKTRIGSIRTSLQRITTIKTRVTNIREAATGIENESDHLRKEIQGQLSEIEESLHRARKAPGAEINAGNGQLAGVI
jgi:hypothetical protein